MFYSDGEAEIAAYHVEHWTGLEFVAKLFLYSWLNEEGQREMKCLSRGDSTPPGHEIEITTFSAIGYQVLKEQSIG